MAEDFDLGEWLLEEKPSVEVEPTPPSMTPNEIRILNYCEQVFWETGVVPTVEAIVQDLKGVNGGNFHELTVRSAFKNETFRTQLATRGVDLDNLIGAAHSKVLSAKQILVANLMLNLHDKRSEREKLALCKVSSQQYHAWLRQPQFVEFIRRRGEALFKSSDAAAYASLVKNVKAGDNASLKLFFEMRGIYNPRLDVNINVDAVITRVIEVVSRHVQSPEVLEAIAIELEGAVEENAS
jgi:hypothetical protein